MKVTEKNRSRFAYLTTFMQVFGEYSTHPRFCGGQPQKAMNTYQVGSCHIATRWLNVRAAFCAGLVILSALVLLPSAHAVDVLTDRNDNNRTGRNPNETILNTGNVNQAQFGKVWAYSVHGSTFAQPLYASGISIAGGTHNVVFIETMEDDAYAFDADSNTQYWHVSFVGGNITPVPIKDITGNNSLNITGDVGIESTPYIDKSTGTIYMLARTKNTSNTTYIQTLHALDITTGAEKFGGPVVVTTSGFNSKMQNQRMGLAEANGNIIITWTSHEDDKPYNGWIMAYNATTLKQAGTFNDTATGTQGGIWQQGRAPAVDASGNVYVITGNGTWDGTKNFGESFLKLSSSLSLEDWFTPDNYSSLNAGDEDLGSGGALLIPGTNIVMGGGKQGTVYLCNTSNLGHEKSGNGQIIQSFAFSSGEIHGGPVYYVSPKNGPVVYDMGNGDHAKEYAFNGSTFNTTRVAESSASAGGSPGGFLSISDNNGASGSGIVWATMETKDDDHGLEPGIVRAWDADNLGGTELWDSNQNSSRDAVGTFVKDASPTIANGRVYIGSYSNVVNVYGLLGTIPPQVAAPVFTPGGGTYTTAQTVSISSSTSSASIRYTTDGATTPSETVGTIYSGPLSISSSPTTLQAIAYKSGMTDSAVTSETYTISAGGGGTFNFEAASMSPVGTGATVSTANDTNVTGGLLEFLNSTAVGQFMTLTTPSIPAGTYEVQFRYKTNTSRAQLSVKIDGTQVGGTIDQYAKTQTYPTVTLGTVTFATTGTHTIVLTVTGKDAAATHFYICADKFTFVGQ
jgi:hypothetical protein